MPVYTREAIELQAILDTMADGMFFIGPDHVIRHWNRAMAELTGYTPDEVVGQSCTLLCREDHCGPGMELVEQRLGEAGRLSKEEIIIRRKNGERIPLAVSARAMTSPQGEHLGAVVTFSDLSELRRLERENRELRDAVRRQMLDELVGESPAMQEVFRLIDLAAASEETILIHGETGTGKELVARAIHRRSTRRHAPLIAVNCAALSESLLESELFGHVKGAFTGAVRDKEGRFEAADGGTILLDEVGELTPLVQVKLLRVLQEHTIERVGESVSRRVDVRVITATHQNLRELAAEGRFRQDLYYRLHVFPIHVPPLRERPGDIEPLLSHFLARFRERTGKDIHGMTPEALRLVMDHDWPGNVRELENAVAHAFVTCPAGEITPADLPRDLRQNKPGPNRQPAPASPGNRQLSRPEIEHALHETGWNKAEAARRLGIDRTTLWRRMKSLGIPLQIPLQ
ncbi:MAG: sigma-54 interaction domain-containing protein [Candidatus Hydrogenedentota bacterium]